MQRLWPDPADIDDVAALVASEERPAPADRPWLLINMVASLDGAITVEGRSGPLGGAADREVFFALRHVADVILVGAGTARAEDYGPPRAPETARAARRARGQTDVPRLALVTRSLDLDPAARMFTDPDNRPLVFTHEGAPRERRDALADVADVVALGAEAVDLPAVMGHLRDTGVASVTCEGGPTLNGDLIEHDLVDEWCLTISPLLVAGDAGRGSRGPVAHPHHFRLDRLLEADGELLGRWIRAR